MDKRWKIFSVIALLTSLAMLATPRLAPICTDLVALAKGSMTYMKCHYTYQGEYIVSLLALIVSGGLFVVKEGEGKRLLSLALIVLGAITVILPQPWAMGICMSPDMACHDTTPFMYAWGALLMVTGGLLVWSGQQNLPTATGQTNQTA